MSAAGRYEMITVESGDGIGRLTLNQPDTLNAWGRPMGREILDALAELGGDREVRVVVLAGAGRAFCSGADLKGGFELREDGTPDVLTALTTLYNPAIIAVREMPKPVIAAVRGGAVGVGCSLALASDFVIASESAYFLLAFVNIGLVPDGGASAFVPSRAGAARATEMAMLGEKVDSARALGWGLCNRVVGEDDLVGEVDRFAARLAVGPTRSYANTKRMLNAHLYPNLPAQLALEAELQQEQAGTEDFMAGAMAFATKSTPEFKGR